jgi:antitoxin (DNA-binding transcriptional repressor) of toxin-antitoxin stability system
VALLSPVQKRKRRKIRFGFMKGKIKFAPDFDDPLPEEILEAFEGGASKAPV